MLKVRHVLKGQGVLHPTEIISADHNTSGILDSMGERFDLTKPI